MSLSQDVLQKMRMQQIKNQQNSNPEAFPIYGINHIYAKTHYIGAFRSPQQIMYNEMIINNQTQKMNRFRFRNLKQLNLRVIQSKSEPKNGNCSASGLKQIVKQQYERFSIKKRYDSALQNYADNQVSEKLRMQLSMVQNSPRLTHKLHYRPPKKHNNIIQGMSVSGSKIIRRMNAINKGNVSQSKLSIGLPQITTSPQKNKFKFNNKNSKINLQNTNGKDEKLHKLQIPLQEQLLGISGWH